MEPKHGIRARSQLLSGYHGSKDALSSWVKSNPSPGPAGFCGGGMLGNKSHIAYLIVSGMLNRGQLLTVPPYLVKRQKQHFHHLEQHGVDLILGCNGFIWVGEHIEAKDDMVEDQGNQSDAQVSLPNRNASSLEEQEKNYTALETRTYICRAANAVRVLSILGFNITLEIIKGIVDLSLSLNLDIHEMLGTEFCVLVAEKEAERRMSNKRRR